MLLSYIVWSPSPAIADLGFTELRWYGLLFALGFILSQQIMFHIFKKEGKPEKGVEILTLYMVLATIVGARLGHVLFYEPARYLSNPIDILKIWEGGLASHGGAIGILVALYLYSRRQDGQKYIWILDRIVIVVALTGALIRTGNFVNSEIIGKPTESDYGVVFGRTVEDRVAYSTKGIEEVSIKKMKKMGDGMEATKATPVSLAITFKENFSEEVIKPFIEGNLINTLTSTYVAEHAIFTEQDILNTTYTMEKGAVTATIIGDGIPRHPAQLYEAISCILLFLFLFYLWNRNRSGIADGRLFGIFLIVCFGLRFVYEFFKENQVDFEDNLALNMGQWLSIPLTLFGVFCLVRSFLKEKGH